MFEIDEGHLDYHFKMREEVVLLCFTKEIDNIHKNEVYGCYLTCIIQF